MAVSTIRQDIHDLPKHSYQAWDANNLVEQGVYHVAITANSPTSTTVYGIMVVFAPSSYIAQLLIGGGITYTRYREGGTWKAWTKLH